MPPRRVYRLRGEALEPRDLLTAYFVSGSGSDTSPGTFDQPFESIQKGVDALSAGDTLFIRGGSYHEEIAINGLDGAPDAPITITNFPGEEVMLDGTIPITNPWIPHSGNIYKTTVDQHVWQLFVDGTMQITARWPNVPVGHPTDPFPAKANGWEPQDGTWWDQDTTWALGADPHNNNGVITVDPSRQDIFGNPLDLAALGVSIEGGSLVLNHQSELTFERAITSHVAGSNTFEHDPLIDPHDTRAPWFYIEHLNALDLPGEWYYVPNDPDNLSAPGGTVYLIADDGQNPTGRAIRGKTQSFFFDMDNSDYVTISGLNFFGTTLQSENGAHITVENSRFSYPSFFARVLGEYEIFHGGVASERHGKVTKLTGPNSASFNTFRNSVVEYTEGMALNMFKGGGDVVDNNLFHHIDFSGVGQIGVETRKDDALVLTRNTFHTGGGSAAFKHGSGQITFNEVHHFGYLQLDGAAFTINSADTSGTVREFNWIHHTPKYGMRWDGNTGMNGVNHHNVGFVVNGTMQVKGDDHDTHHNTILDSTVRNGIIILSESGTQNQSSRSKNNLSDRIAGHRSRNVALYPIPGDHTNNWNGYLTGEDVRTQLRDPDNFDFRPKAGAEVVDAGVVLPGITGSFLGAAPDIGPYEYGDNNYWIPGRIVEKASHPIAPDGATDVKLDANLMWREGRDATSFDVFYGDSPTLTAADFQGNQSNNIFSPGILDPNQQYYWRIDTITPTGTVTGDTWTFASDPVPFNADYNGNGLVDAADYSLWRDTLGSTTNLTADGNDDGVVNQIDYDVWRALFGAVVQTNTAVADSPDSSATAASTHSAASSAVRQQAFAALASSSLRQPGAHDDGPPRPRQFASLRARRYVPQNVKFVVDHRLATAATELTVGSDRDERMGSRKARNGNALPGDLPTSASHEEFWATLADSLVFASIF